MSGSKPSLEYAVKIKNETGAELAKVQKSIVEAGRSAEAFGNSMYRWSKGGVTAKLAEGIRMVGFDASETARSVERLSSGVSGITSAASLAGMSALVSRWANLGQQVFLTSQRLSVPVNRLTALEGAMKLAGGSAEDMDSGLSSLDQSLRDATFRGGPALQVFDQLRVKFKDASGHARNAVDALDDVADGVHRLYNSGPDGRGAALQATRMLGLEKLFPLLIKGRAGIRALTDAAGNLGMVITPEQAKRANDLKTSFEGLKGAVEGVENRLGDKWGAAVKPYIDSAATWIGKNKELADSYAAIGVGILALGQIKRVGWVMRMLGLGSAPEVAIPALPLMLKGDTDPKATPNGFRPGWVPYNGPAPTPYMGPTQSLGDWLHSMFPSWLGGPKAQAPRGIRNNNPLNLEYHPGEGATGSDGRFATFGSMPAGVAAGERLLLRYEDQGYDTISKIISRWAPASENDTAAYIADVSRETGYSPDAKLDMRDPFQARNMIYAMAHHENGQAIDARAIQTGVDQALHGTVAVTVTLQNAPPGTTVRTSTSGAVTSPPVRVETAMPGY